MKRILSTCALLILFAGISSAQVRDLSVREFDDAMVAAFGAADKKVRRITVTVTEFEERKELRTGVSAYEHIPPDRFRSYLVSSSGSAKDSWEYIEANDKYYFKDKSDVWTYFSYGCSDIPPYLFWSVKKAGLLAEIKTSQVREESLNGTTVKRYSRESRQNFTSPEGYQPTRPVDGFDEVWIGTNGLVLKAESMYYYEDKKNLSQKWLLTYEYDPKNIKIEAPIK